MISCSKKYLSKEIYFILLNRKTSIEIILGNYKYKFLDKSIYTKKKKNMWKNFIYIIHILFIFIAWKYRSNFPFGDIDNYQFLIYLISASSSYREIAYSDCITVGRQGYVKNAHTLSTLYLIFPRNVKSYTASFVDVSKRIARTKEPSFFFPSTRLSVWFEIYFLSRYASKDSAGSSQRYSSNTRYIPLTLLDCLIRNTVRPSMNSLGDY